MTQPDLLAWTPPPTDRGGATYSAPRGFARLNAQQADVWAFVRDGHWHTLREIAAATGHPEASVSARLRDFRKMGKAIEREYVERGLFKYRVVA